MAIAYLCLGSNLGEREANLCQALALLSLRVNLEEVSSIYETEPVGFREQPMFLNLVCRIETDMPPEELLHVGKDIEKKLGRAAKRQANSPRPIDIDILFYGNTTMETPDLTIPHPRLKDRAFVLIPLNEIAPDVTHPQLGKTLSQLAKDAEGQEGVRKWYHMQQKRKDRQNTRKERLTVGTKGRKNVKKPKQDKEKKK